MAKTLRPILLLVLVALAVVGMYVVKWELWNTRQFVLVIDAGSSGTRINAFEIRMPKDANAGRMPQLIPIPPDAAPDKVPRRAFEARRAYKRVETEPGLDKFLDTPWQIGPDAIDPLLDWAHAVIPRRQWSSTPIFLFGTAGLRRMEEIDRSKVMEEVKKCLMKSGLLFESHWARVISGRDEGLFGWVALNAASDMLGSDSTLGVLDLGGSSLEVTYAQLQADHDDIANGSADESRFEHARDLPPPPQNVVNASFFGLQYNLYSYSHHHFGLDDAFDRSITLLLDASLPKGKQQDDIQQDRRTNVFHPCLHQGYQKEHTRISVYGEHPKPETVVLRGAPNFDACLNLARAVAQCDRPPPLCRLRESRPPPGTGRFAALSGFYVVSHFFNVSYIATEGSYQMTQPSEAVERGGASSKHQDLLDAVLSAGKSFCALPWEEVETRHQGELSPETYCFRAPYIQYLLTDGLGLRKGDVAVPSGPLVSWTLGAALAEGHRLTNLFHRKSSLVFLKEMFSLSLWPSRNSRAGDGSTNAVVKPFVKYVWFICIFAMVMLLLYAAGRRFGALTRGKSLKLGATISAGGALNELKLRVSPLVAFRVPDREYDVNLSAFEKQNRKEYSNESAKEEDNRVHDASVAIAGSRMARSHTYSRRLSNLENGYEGR